MTASIAPADLNQAILQVAAMEEAIASQIAKLEQEIKNLKQTRDASKVNPEIILRLIDKLKNANAEIVKGVEAKKKEQDAQSCSPCCTRVCAAFTCSKEKINTIHLIGAQALSTLVACANSVSTVLFPKEDSDIQGAWVNIGATCAAGIFSGFLICLERKKIAADRAAKEAVAKIRRKKVDRELKQKDWLEALAAFKADPDTPALKRCITTIKILEQENEPDKDLVMPTCSEMVVGLINTMPEGNECKKLVDEITTHAKQNLDGSPKQANLPASDKVAPPLPLMQHSRIQPLTTSVPEGKVQSEQDEKLALELVEREPSEQARIKESEQAEYSRKWTELEHLLGTPLDDLVLQQEGEISCNKQGECWRPSTPKQKGSDDEPTEKDRFISERSSDHSNPGRVTRIATPYLRGVSDQFGTPPTPSSARLNIDSSMPGTNMVRRPSTPINGMLPEVLSSGLPSNSDIFHTPIEDDETNVAVGDDNNV